MNLIEPDDRIVCSFLVTRGANQGGKYLIPESETLTSGVSITNDIVINDPSVEPWNITLVNRQGVVYLTTDEGELYRESEVLDKGETYEVEDHHRFIAGNTEFGVTYDRPVPDSIKAEPDMTAQPALIPGQLIKVKSWSRVGLRHVLFGFSAFTVLLGTLAAIYAVTGSLIMMVNATPGPVSSKFEEQMMASDVGSAAFDLAEDGSGYVVSGMVDSREQRNKILEIASDTETKVKLDLQVNDQLSEAVEDIYRVHGFKANVEVLGRGQVKVSTQANDLEKLNVVAVSAKRDIPALQEIEVVNDPPGTVMKPRKPAKHDPDKRVTLIAAGKNAYIMTHDQSRYFVGALLPSGHVVESIEDGLVIVSREGKKETLKY